jgi:hypothetical protein
VPAVRDKLGRCDTSSLFHRLIITRLSLLPPHYRIAISLRPSILPFDITIFDRANSEMDISRFERLPKKQQIDELRRLDIVVKDEKATKSAFEKQYNAYIGGEDHTHSEGGEDTTPKVCVASLLFKVRG